MIFFIFFIFSQDIDLDRLYNEATTLLVQFQAEQESAFAKIVALGQDSIYADTTIAYLVSNFDTKVARQRHRMKDIFVQIGESAVDNIVEKIEYRGSDKDARSLKQSLWVLGEIGSEKIIEPVGRFVDDKEWQIRSSAYTALGKAKSRKAFALIVKGLDDTNEVVRKSAYYALGEIAKIDDLDYFLAGLDDDFYGVRYAAARGLVNIGSDIGSLLIDEVGKGAVRDYYLLEVLRQLDMPEQKISDLAGRVRPETRYLIYDMCNNEEMLSTFMEHEDNIFLRNFLLEKTEQ